jgi:iron complex outermembrane recepter protein
MTTDNGRRGRLARASVTSALGTALLVGYVLPATAADDQQKSTGSAQEGELAEVQVTGTRIAQRSDYVSPTPTLTFAAEDLEKLGIVNVSDAMTQIPQNVSQFTPANTGGSAFFIGSTLANLRGLNPFFGTRTLTLVDTRRFIPTTQGDAVDLNFIPSIMIQRMETVTGGASAAYGSGAISGVVNVILDKRLQGIKFDADYGLTDRNDGKNWHWGLAGGTDFAGGRGHIVAGGEMQNSDAIQSCADARSWCSKGYGLFDNNTGFAFGPGSPITPKIPGLPEFNHVYDLRANQLSSTGVIWSPTPGSTWQFNDAGTDIVPFAIGQTGQFAVGGSAIGGDGDSIYKNMTLYPEVKRATSFSHVDYDISDRLGVYGELSYGQVKGTNHQWSTFNNAYSVCVRPDNAYLGTLSTAAQNAIAAGANNSAFTNFFNGGCFGGTILSKDWYPQDDQTVTTDTKVLRGVVGMNGKLGQNWNWDAYYQYGKTKRDQIGRGYFSNWRLTMALDSVIDPGTGQPVCRAVLTGQVPSSSPFGYVPVADPSLITGCQPLNPFGQAASQAAMDYAFGSLTEHDDIRQDVIAASMNGTLWEGWAGPIGAAAGIEWRKDRLNNDAGDLPVAERTDFSLQYGDSFAGDTKVTEAFTEVEVPLLKDLPGARLWTVNGAVRYAKYETTGGFGTIGGTNKQNITTWKFASVWDPISWLRVRGSYSHDIRAASFRELFYSQTIPPGGIFGNTNNPWIDASLLPPGQTASDAAYLILTGNPAVKPEKAKTITAGFVLTPGGWAQGMHFSADYYQIKLVDGLSLGGVNVVQECFNDPNSPYCDYLTFGPGLPGQETNPNFDKTNITSTRTIYGNLSPYKTKGVDLSWDYGMALDRFFSQAPGRLDLRLTASDSLKTIVPSGIDVSGQNGADQGFLSDFASSPDWSANFTVSYTNGPFVGTLQTRWVSSGILDKQNPKTDPSQAGYDPTMSFSVDDNTIGNYYLFNATASWDFKPSGFEKLQVFLTINNLLDRNPPLSATATGTGGVNAALYDALGRTYRLGVRMKL